MTQYAEGDVLLSLVDQDSSGDVLAYLRKGARHCHSDLGQALIDAAKDKCGEWTAYSPSFAEFRYIAFITNRRIFALGVDMGSAFFRLPASLREVALETGGFAAEDLGAEWVRLELWQSNHPKVDLPFWMLGAYAAAREELKGDH